jgi:hypothetical protein
LPVSEMRLPPFPPLSGGLWDGTHPDAAGSLAVTWPGVKAWLEKRSGK